MAVQPTTLRADLRQLRQFEGGRALLRLPPALGLFFLPPAAVIGGAVFMTVTAAGGRVVATALTTTATLLLASAAAWIRRRFPWRDPIARRLARYTEPNPSTHVEILLPGDDVDRALQALRRAKFNPTFLRRTGNPPPDAPWLDYCLGVEEPAAVARSTNEADRLAGLRTVIARAGVTARVGGGDVGATLGATGRPRTTANAGNWLPEDPLSY